MAIRYFKKWQALQCFSNEECAARLDLSSIEEWIALRERPEEAELQKIKKIIMLEPTMNLFEYSMDYSSQLLYNRATCSQVYEPETQQMAEVIPLQRPLNHGLEKGPQHGTLADQQ